MILPAGIPLIITGRFNMGSFYLRCRSVTYAQRALKTLEKSGVPGTVVKLPQHLSEEGCGYSIKIGKRWIKQAYSTLVESGFEIRNIYSQSNNGEYKEVLM